MRDYESLCTAVTTSDILVNRHTDEVQTVYVISSAMLQTAKLKTKLKMAATDGSHLLALLTHIWYSLKITG